MSSGPQVIIFHGTGSGPEGNWYRWLQHELQGRGIAAALPAFPTPQGQSWANWRELFYDEFEYLTPGMVLIGHSVGCAMILRLLEESHHQVCATLLAAGWHGLLNNPELDPLICSFCQPELDWGHIRERAGRVIMFHGDNDPYVPLKLGRELAYQLAAQLEIIPGGGHLNAESGFTAFPEMLSAVMAALTQ